MPLKMMMMCKKYIITLQTSNYKKVYLARYIDL